MLKGRPDISRPSDPSKAARRNSFSSDSSIAESESELELKYSLVISEEGAALSSSEAVEQSEQVDGGGIT